MYATDRKLRRMPRSTGPRPYDSASDVCILYVYTFKCLFFICLYVERCVLLVYCCYANDVIKYDRRRSEIPSASLNMEYDNNSIEN